MRDRGHDVLVVDNLSSQIHGEIPNITKIDGIRFVRLDVRDLADRFNLLEDRDVIFHFAAETGTGQSMYQIAQYVSVNDLGCALLLEGLLKCSKRARHIILASSRSVYGEGAYERINQPGLIEDVMPRTRSQLELRQWEPIGLDGSSLRAVATAETQPFRPTSIYAATKISQEMLLTSASIGLGFKCTIFRFQNVYGEGQSLKNPYTGIISIFFNRARQGLRIPLYEDGNESRDFIHVNDVIDALESALLADIPSPIVFNLGSGCQTSVRALAEKLVEVSGHKVPIVVTGQYRIGDIRHCFADIRRVQNSLGFIPKINIEIGLKRFVAWASQQPIYQDKLLSAEKELRDRGLGS